MEETVEGVVLYTQTSEEIAKGVPTFVVTILFETSCGPDVDFWRSLPEKDWMNAILEKTRKMPLRNLKYEYTEIGHTVSKKNK